MDLEEAFQILSDYKKTQKEVKEKQLVLERMEAQKQKQPEEEEEEESDGEKGEQEEDCLHQDQVLHEGSYVCTRCGLVLTSDFQPEVNWTDRCVAPHIYSATDRLQAVDKHLIHFMEKVGISAPLHPIQEKLRFMKKESRYRGLNYAIALTCILEHDSESQARLRPYLPRSNVAWARSSRLLMKPLPEHFIRVWYRHLATNAKQLSKFQMRKLCKNITLLKPEQSNLMYHLITLVHPEQGNLMSTVIRPYGCHGYDIFGLPPLLQCVLYRFSCAALQLTMK